MDGPVEILPGLALPRSEIELRFTTSGGPGGQHANRARTRVEAVFDVTASETLSEHQRRRLLAALGERVVAAAEDARSQARNRELAVGRLAERLAAALAEQPARRPTRPTAGARRRRLDAKRRRSETKRGRRRPGRGD